MGCQPSTARPAAASAPRHTAVAAATSVAVPCHFPPLLLLLLLLLLPPLLLLLLLLPMHTAYLYIG